MVIRNYHLLKSASRVLISTCSAPLVQMGERKRTHTVWPLTYDLDLQSQGQGRPSCQKSRSNGSNRRAPTNRRTHTRGRYQMYYLPCYTVDKEMLTPSNLQKVENMTQAQLFCICFISTYEHYLMDFTTLIKLCGLPNHRQNVNGFSEYHVDIQCR